MTSFTCQQLGQRHVIFMLIGTEIKDFRQQQVGRPQILEHITDSHVAT